MLLLTTLALAGPNTAMIGVEQSQDIDNITTAAVAQGGTVRACYQRARFCVVDFPSPPPLRALAALPGVRYAEADRLIEPGQQALADVSGTADCPDLWDLAAIRIGDAWGLSLDGPVIAVADGGFLQTHEEISGQITGQFDYGNSDPVADLEWDVSVPDHGTFIATIIAGKADNGAGRAGVIPGGRLNLLKIADSSGAMYFSYAASALADVADGDLGIGVVNYSIGSTSFTASFQDAVASLADVGVVLVAAAGNCTYANCADADNDAIPMYPASFDFEHVIAVAGSTQDGGYNPYSHYGASSVDLAAPGVDLCSAGVYADDNYYTASGTSYATPLVAGAAGLLMGAHPDLSTTEVGRVLRASAAKNSDWTGMTRSGGVLDVAAALQTAVPRLDAPADVRVDTTATLELSLENPGALGTGYIVLTHPPGFTVTDAGDWSVTTFVSGDTLNLPDAGTLTATTSGTLLINTLNAHESTTLSLQLSGAELGSWPTTARLVAASTGADYLNAPYDEGTLDATGFLAWNFTVEVTAVAAHDSEPPPESDPITEDSEPIDTATFDDNDTQSKDDPTEPAGCGCHTLPSSGGLLGGLMMASVLIRRSRQTRSTPPTSPPPARSPAAG